MYKNFRVRQILLFIFLFSILIYFFGYITSNNTQNSIIASNQKLYQNFTNGSNGKLILFWSDHFGSWSLSGWGIHENTLDNCDTKCDFTVDRNSLEQSDAVVFQADVFLNFRNKMPQKRYDHQIYLMYWFESPQYTFLPLKRWNNFFNMTITYRRDSDIYMPYGSFEKLKPEDPREEKPTVESIKNKKLGAWLVSSCHSVSNREDLFQKLQEYVPIDVFGLCGPNKCVSKRCMEDLGKKYKFYLSFENSLCQDYLTEKFFGAYRYGFVPVLFGIGAEKIAPPHSYIDARNFSSPKELANYLIYLDKNDEEYLKYFEWKENYKVNNYFKNEICEICKKVSEFNKNDLKMRKSYSNLHEWWFGTLNNSTCFDNLNYSDILFAFLDYIL